MLILIYYYYFLFYIIFYFSKLQQKQNVFRNYILTHDSGWYIGNTEY